MRYNLYSVFVIVLLLSSLPLLASETTEKSLVELDRYIKKKEHYVREKENTIDSLREKLLSATSDNQRLGLYSAMFGEFQSYIHDSAYHYSRQHLELAKRLENQDNIYLAKIEMAFCYLSSGLFKESHDLLKSIGNLESASVQVKREYYILISRHYYDMADYSRGEVFAQSYIDKGVEYCDSAINYLSIDDPQLWSIVGLKRMQQRLFDEAIDAFQVLLHSSRVDDHTCAIASSSIGYMYATKGDTERATRYLAQAAISDIKSATKEAVALQILAKILFASGDVERANSYVRIAMEDANFYNARHRKIEISGILPIIEKERSEMVEKQRNSMLIFAVLVSITLILLLISMGVILRQVRKLRTARRIIMTQNSELKRNNTLLREANEIKDRYIVQTLYSKSEYIDTLDKLHRVIESKLKLRKYDEIEARLKEYDVKKERENMFLSFDQTFLQLFPTFVEEYNQLFEPTDRAEPSEDGSLTAEQRIFALIRLGITESDKIAFVLDYSVHTISTYKTRVKNRSIIENELFEEQVMKIPTVGQSGKG